MPVYVVSGGGGADLTGGGEGNASDFDGGLSMPGAGNGLSFCRSYVHRRQQPECNYQMQGDGSAP